MAGTRSAALEADTLAISAAWVSRVRRDLYHDNRATAGGWPGTMREARAHTYAYFTSVTGVERHGVLSAAEFDLAVHAVYECARRRWLAYASHEDEEEDQH